MVLQGIILFIICVWLNNNKNLKFKYIFLSNDIKLYIELAAKYWINKRCIKHVQITFNERRANIYIEKLVI